MSRSEKRILKETKRLRTDGYDVWRESADLTRQECITFMLCVRRLGAMPRGIREMIWKTLQERRHLRPVLIIAKDGFELPLRLVDYPFKAPIPVLEEYNASELDNWAAQVQLKRLFTEFVETITNGPMNDTHPEQIHSWCKEQNMIYYYSHT